jgi:hypothetical protein
MALSVHNRSLLNRADPRAVESAFEHIKDNWGRNRWLLERNRYAKHCIKNIRRDNELRKPAIHRHLREYIAASSICHCMDAWSFLGKSIEAHLEGNPYIARHLGYYAELRAAMALLATQGIGVFDRYHSIVNNQHKCQYTNAASTHEFVWDALECWAETQSAVDLIFSVISPGGLPLKDWLNRSSLTPGLRGILAKRWLLEWGLDLKRFRDDREARNSSSYRPTAFTNSRAINVTDAIKFVRRFWEICEPNESIRFPIIDRYILRSSLDVIFHEALGLSRKKAKRIYKDRVNEILAGLNPGDLTANEWIHFLNYSDSTDLNLILTEARKDAPPTNPRHHIQVLARATLLSRLATGASYGCLRTLNEFNKSDLKFWWNSVGEDSCLWDQGDPPDSFVDLWTDIRESLDAIEAWEEEHKDSHKSYSMLWREQRAARLLGTCERIGLWGLGL